MEEEKVERFEGPIFKDIRRYFCEYCGICRSKKSLITSHILTHHQLEQTVNGGKEEEGIPSSKSNTCEECGAVFKKPAHLKQHMQSHSLEREALDPIERTPKCEGLLYFDLNGPVSGWETS